MNFMKQKSRSVFYIVSLFLFLLVVQVILYGKFFEELKADTETIHDLSRIRGAIQRYTKLEIAMYQAKENGRNRWEAIGGEEENE